MALSPDKANSPLIVDADRVLALAFAAQGFQPIAGRYLKVLKPLCVVQHT
jgi:hypothetical protein